MIKIPEIFTSPVMWLWDMVNFSEVRTENGAVISCILLHTVSKQSENMFPWHSYFITNKCLAPPSLTGGHACIIIITPNVISFKIHSQPCRCHWIRRFWVKVISVQIHWSRLALPYGLLMQETSLADVWWHTDLVFWTLCLGKTNDDGNNWNNIHM